MRLLIDPIACRAHGQCAELLPELIELDDWGYPIVVEPEVPRALEDLARRAVSACPMLALTHERSLIDGRARSGSRSPAYRRRTES